MYLNLNRMMEMNREKEKPAKKTGLLGMPITQEKEVNTGLDLSMQRVASYMDMLRDKRQELKDGD